MTLEQRRKKINTGLSMLALSDLPTPVKEAVGAMIEEIIDLTERVESLEKKIDVKA